MENSNFESLCKGKEVNYAYSAPIADVGAVISAKIGAFDDSEHLMSVDVKCGFDNETGAEVARIFIRAFVGDINLMKPRC